MSNFEKVKKFMQTFGQEVKNEPSFPNDKIVKFKIWFNTRRVIRVKIRLCSKEILQK